ncbi:hypothetical protein FDG2_4128 [Candidatus Protofrankia californiensis]|uniref:Uncharacterized protein n=1 Tax=Candidatus Protofrankia californiensis TaxID=1839754 RepID=A0A1C3P3M3_9ACTN|nr:hypothetical protein FDG2_4128 [Candidatus Protofrankia californiensis]
MTVYRWVQRFTPLLTDASRPCRHAEYSERERHPDTSTSTSYEFTNDLYELVELATVHVV